MLAGPMDESSYEAACRETEKTGKGAIHGVYACCFYGQLFHYHGNRFDPTKN